MATSPLVTDRPVEPESRDGWLRRIVGRSNVGWLIGCLILVILGAIGAAIQIVPSARQLYLQQNLADTFKPPLSAGHLLGTDNLGQDLAWQLIGGLGTSLVIGIGVTVISVVLGLVVGILGGFFGRVADALSNVVIDVTWAFPAILLAVVLAGWIGPSLTTVILALSLTNWAGFARIVRGEVLSLRERDFVSAARVLGVPKVIISVRHLVTNLIPVTIVLSVYFIATSIIGEAGLTFLGLGVQPPMPSLGLILSTGRQYLAITWWPVVLSGAMLSLLVLFLNAFGDYLRDRLDPQGKVRRR